jgi:hypothetical protein
VNLTDPPDVTVEHEPSTRRRGNRRWRQTGYVLLGLVLAVLVVAVLRRPGAPPTRSVPAPAATPSQESHPVPAAAGASRIEAGVPVGYPRTQSGAVSAATNYLVAFTQPRMFQPAVRRQVLTVLAGPELAPDLIRSVDPGMQRAAETLSVDPNTGTSSMGDLVSRLVPVGYQVVSYNNDRARVAVWGTSLAGVAGASSRMPVVNAWATDTIDLTWDGDWRWAGFVESTGPTPVGTVNPPSSWSDIAGAVTGFSPYGYGSQQ